MPVSNARASRALTVHLHAVECGSWPAAGRPVTASLGCLSLFMQSIDSQCGQARFWVSIGGSFSGSGDDAPVIIIELLRLLGAQRRNMHASFGYDR